MAIKINRGKFAKSRVVLGAVRVTDIPIIGELELQSMTIVKQFHFDAAHQLVDRPGTICGDSIHGHRFTLEVGVFAALNKYGMVTDLIDLKSLVEEALIVPFLDHHNLNETVEPVHPTSEFLIGWIATHLNDMLPQKLGVLLTHLRLYETPTGWAELSLLSDFDRSYIAGLFDGEGNISQSGGTELQIRISNTDLGALQWCQSRIGGTVQRMTPGSNSPIKSNKQAYSLVLSVGRARAVAAALLPYSKLEQKRKVLAVLAHFPRLETGWKKADDNQIQVIVDHLNSVSLINSPEKEPTFSVELWKEKRDKFHVNRKRAAKKSREAKDARD